MLFEQGASMKTNLCHCLSESIRGVSVPSAYSKERPCRETKQSKQEIIHNKLTTVGLRKISRSSWGKEGAVQWRRANWWYPAGNLSTGPNKTLGDHYGDDDDDDDDDDGNLSTGPNKMFGWSLDGDNIPMRIMRMVVLTVTRNLLINHGDSMQCKFGRFRNMDIWGVSADRHFSTSFHVFCDGWVSFWAKSPLHNLHDLHFSLPYIVLLKFLIQLVILDIPVLSMFDSWRLALGNVMSSLIGTFWQKAWSAVKNFEEINT